METSIFSTMASDTSTFIPVAMSNSEGMPLWNLVELVFEAIAEVVCVSLPGFILAKSNLFDKSQQKFIQKLNNNLFTPCLIFSKLGHQLDVSKLSELGIIPVIWIVQTLVSYLCAQLVCWPLGLGKRATRFVTAMAVFGNSSSLPMSILVALSMTISGLHWDKIPGDNDEQVAARGILYLVLFQQLGQVIRWSWGSSVLLAKRGIDEEYDTGILPDHKRQIESLDGNADERTGLLARCSTRLSYNGSHKPAQLEESGHKNNDENDKKPSLWYRIRREPKTVLKGAQEVFLEVMNPSLWAMVIALVIAVTPPLKNLFFTPGTFINNSVTRAISQSGNVAVPLTLVALGGQLALVDKKKPESDTDKFDYSSLDENEPTVPEVHWWTLSTKLSEEEKRKFDEQLKDAQKMKEQNKERVHQHEKKLLIASLVSRMVFPFIIMFAFLSWAAIKLQISVLDDPIFLVVCCLLAGSPTALQMSQICAENEVYEDTMVKISFWSYVVLVLPSTMISVIGAMKLVDWAR
ncbi:auxin efflux carrier [Ascobolus immersus RN42]|uniref:Auxin efflux carrier n=1 Tax=Ascobolus immersus RN42 TaxID=1160509 RepID=A0A3N4IGM5_ASCIM|nr:auxin efflux carrier [Ascobolus immersus RN42]